MRKEKITMRLYKMHDLDLITFIETHELDYKKAMYCALSAFAKGEVFIIKLPPKRDKELTAKRTYIITLQLDKEIDKEAIMLLRKITDGKRNSFLKNLLRLYLCNPMSEKYLKDEADEEYFNQKFSIFREGKRIANLDEEKELNSYFKKKSSKSDKIVSNTSDLLTEVKKAETIEEESPTSLDKENNNIENNEVEIEVVKEDKIADTSIQDIQSIEDTEEDVENAETSDSENITDLFSSFL